MEYVFLLGGSRDLAIKELISCGVTGIRSQGTHAFGEYQKDIFALQDMIGGTVKISSILAQTTPDNVFQTLVSTLTNLAQGKKINVMANVYGTSEEILPSVLPRLKKELDIPFRFLNQQYKNVASVLFSKRKHEKNTFEINILYNEYSVYITQTLSAQNVDAYSMRDMERPHRDLKNGMMPPKLCQMLLNIAGGKTVWDPFCGNGTMVMEGVLQGRMMYGSDISENIIAKSEKNMEWFEDTYQKTFPSPCGHFSFFSHDAKEPIQLVVDTICSEGFLGTPLKKIALKKDTIETDTFLTDLYSGAFARFSLQKIKKIVLCLPWYSMRHGEGRMEKTHQTIQERGYTLTWSYLYGTHQRIKREICVFEQR